MMALLFVLFPRIGPLWGVPQDGISTTGLSNSMQHGLGGRGRAATTAIALRMRFDGAAPPPQAMYFRGPVLTRFDGIEWRRARRRSRAPRVPRPARTCACSGQPLRYEMTLEPLRLATLPLLEATTARRADRRLPAVAARDDLQWLADRPILERLRFEAEAYPRFRHGPPRRAGELQEQPASCRPASTRARSPGPRALRASRAMRAPTRAALAQRACCSTSAPAATATRWRRAPTAATRSTSSGSTASEGFCEHFAAAFVVVMRAIGVPARVVTGYQGADPQPVDGYYIVRQSSAHAWAEYWQHGVRLGPRRPDRRGRARPHRRSRALRAAAGLRRRRARQRQPGAARAAARGLGGAQQPLEPVGAQLLARPAARPAEEPRLRARRAGKTWRCC